MSLSQPRNTRRRERNQNHDPVAASTTIYQGGLVCLDASGNAVPGAVSATLVARGRAEDTVDNSAGSAGDLNVRTTVGVFQFANDGVAAVTRAHIGDDCYILDDETVSSDDDTGARSVAGRVIDVDSGGVWVEIL